MSVAPVVCVWFALAMSFSVFAKVGTLALRMCRSKVGWGAIYIFGFNAQSLEWDGGPFWVARWR